MGTMNYIEKKKRIKKKKSNKKQKKNWNNKKYTFFLFLEHITGIYNITQLRTHS